MVVVRIWLVDKKLKMNLTCIHPVFSYVAYVVVKNWLVDKKIKATSPTSHVGSREHA
jgi:hypothetical protein